MAVKPGTRNFGGPISEELKDRIDEQLSTSKLPMGRIIEAMAEWWVTLDVEEQRLFCYGVNTLTWKDFVRQEVAGYFQSPEGAAVIDEAFAAHSARQFVRKRRRPLNQSERSVG